MPIRVKDLPILEPDSDDDNVEHKQPNKEAPHNDSVRNSSGIVTSSKSLGAFSNMMFPKRSSELPTLDSDESEEEEDNPNTDNLNCAILNDSFINSPADYSVLNTPGSSSATKKKRRNENLSFLSDFNRLSVHADDKENVDKYLEESSLSMFNKTSQPIAVSIERKTHSSRNISSCPLQSIKEDQVANNKSGGESESLSSGGATAGGALQRFHSDPTSQHQSKRLELDTPLRQTESTIDTEAYNAKASASTTGPTGDTLFATPQVRSFSVQRRPRELCSTQSQKARSAIANEFRSQKVLFQTPMAITRAPIVCLPNESITLSLCDTIGGGAANTPNTAESTPQEKNKVNNKLKSAEVKSKKSLEKAFDCPVKLDDSKANEQANSKTQEKSTSSNKKDGILSINNEEYTIEKKIGCGGSSSVYLAHRNGNGKECAVKVVDLRGDPVVVEGYLNETKLLAKLQGNVCVVALYDYQLLQKESRLFLVMEKGDSDLHKILQSYTTNLPLYVLMNFWYQMLQAVNYIHQNGVIHSDLKPANFLMINGRLKLIDFGIASNIAMDSTSIIKFSQAGTFNYISPEALIDTSTGSSPMRSSNQPKIKISTKSDVWSLGCILYLLLYKRTPFSHIKNIYAKINAITSPTTNIEYPTIPLYYPAMLVHMARNCLQHNQKKRPSCAELLQYPFNMVIPIQNLAVPSTVKEKN
ncbi:dual specificity protein kinase TTK isoform X2 [Eurosta solidaginis]|uniref:dual specificity protein kinase TTK isoform X2 n=1 Tax=Eurosta solidaginis TaxID=178769 RepID=UPI003530AA2F